MVSEQYGKCLKLGVHGGSTNRTKAAELLRFRTSKSGDEQISLKEYVDRTKEGQNDIFYITCESFTAGESFSAVQQLFEFDGKKLKSSTKEGLDIEDEDEKKKLEGKKPEEPKAEFETLTKLVLEVLGDKTERVVVSGRMAVSPCVLSTSVFAWSANMEPIMKAQALRDELHDFLHGFQEDHGDQPHAFHHD